MTAMLRVSNVPVPALTRYCIWKVFEPGVSAVKRLHADPRVEVAAVVKNEFP
jgi:hypothetical protein